MNYQKHYNLLIKKSQNRILEGYVERHHILPKCLGGSNNKENIAILTAEEHFVAHQLLVKIYPGNHSLAHAAIMMCTGSKNQLRNNKMFGWLRKKHAEAVSLQTKGKPKGPFTEEHKKNIGKASTGRFKSQSAKDAVSKANKGKPKSDEHKRKIGLGNKDKIISEETRLNQSIAQKKRFKENPKTVTKETKLNMSIAQKKRFSKERDSLCLSK